MTKMNLRIEHQVPGRVRMKIPAGKGNPDLLKQVSELFGVIPGIEKITVNPDHRQYHPALRRRSPRGIPRQLPATL